MRVKNVVHNFFYNAVVSRKISNDGNGEKRSTFIHVQSISNFLNSVITGEIRPGRNQNIFKEILSIGEVAERLKHVLPSLGMIYVNQKHTLVNLLLAENKTTYSLCDKNSQDYNISSLYSNYFQNK